MPHAPQLFASLFTSTQVPLQLVEFGAEHGEQLAGLEVLEILDELEVLDVAQSATH